MANPVPILNNEHCTVFHYVRTIHINCDSVDAGQYQPRPNWMENFLRHMPKFVALRSLELVGLKARDLQDVGRSIPQSIKNNIKQVSMYLPQYRMSQFAAFLSKFTALETLLSLGGNSQWGQLTQGVAPPPASIRELSCWGLLPQDLLATSILKWFVDLHSGIIDSMNPSNVPSDHPVEFQRFLTRFGATLSKIVFMIDGETGAGNTLNLFDV